MQDDLDCAFLTDAMGQVRYANTGAVMRFGDCTGWRLADLFGSFLANPHPFLERLSHGAHLTGASKEDVITRSGHFRLSVVVISPALRLWRLLPLALTASALPAVVRPMRNTSSAPSAIGAAQRPAPGAGIT